MIVHEYETIYITRPELPEEEIERLAERFAGAIEQRKGTILVREDWGVRKLAYPIQKHPQGHYFYLDFAATADVPAELERLFRIEYNVIRFLTVRIGENVDVDELRRKLAEGARRRPVLDDDEPLDEPETASTAEPAEPAPEVERADEDTTTTTTGPAPSEQG